MSETLEITQTRDIFTQRPVSIRLEDGKVAWVGPPEAMPAFPPPARRIAAGGRWLCPGFCESHLHLFWGGATLGQLNMLEISGAEAAAAALHAFAAQNPGEELLVAYSANYEILGPGTRPDRSALDALLPGRPLLMLAVDGHAAWANSAALVAAGLSEHAPVLEGAEVMLGPDGRPNGELREGAAMELVLRLAANGARDTLAMAGDEPLSVSPEARARDKATLSAALTACAALGITTAVNMDGNLYQASLFRELEAEGRLPIRVSLAMRLSPAHDPARIDALIAAAAAPPQGRLSFGRIKIFMDGVFDTWTAFRTDDYPGRPGFRSEPLIAPAAFAELCRKADARGLQIQVHCVGDGAVRATLDGFAAAAQANGQRDARHRIEHIDMLHPDDLPRLAALGVIASMQPVHPPGSCGLPLEPTVSIMGRARWADTFPWCRLSEAGVPLAFGTDWPTAPLSPFGAIHAALSRQPWAEDVPDQRLPFAAVIAAYTSGGAYALFAEARRGTLAPGMEADLVLLDGDPRGLSATSAACRAWLTVCDGVVVHEEAA